MAFIHGKNTYISLGGTDLSAYTNASELERTGDTSDVTTYGKDSHVYSGGLKDAKASISGIYDNTAVSGPRAVIEPLVGTSATLIRRPEGTGSGKPQESVTVFVTKYTETNPVADMVTWSADLQCSDAITKSSQA